jgi:branched-chain amino acid transport system substrate-binding protein
MISRRGLVGLAAALGARRLARAQAGAKPIRIGILEDMSGVFSDLGGQNSLLAARMAVADFGGAVLGRPIELLGGDHQNKPDVGAALARRWYDVEGVGLITGLTNSAVALQVHKLAAEKDRIDIVVNAATDALIEENCSPNGILWNHSARAIVTATVAQVAKSSPGDWFFITSDYAGGRIMENEAEPILRAAARKLVGAVHPPVGTSDFSSELITARSSGAKFLGVVTFGRDFANLMKQFEEFGVARSMRPVVPFVYLSDLREVGPRVIGGMTVAAPFYWDFNDETRAWSARFRGQTGRAPDMGHGGVYTAVTHYLKGVRAAGTDEARAVLQAMRNTPVEDMYTNGAHIRADGMVVRPIYLFEGKRPEESHDPWDLLRQTGVVDKDAAFPLPAEAKCHLLRS